MISNKAIFKFIAIAFGVYFLSTILVSQLGLERGVSDMTRGFASTIFPKVEWVSNYQPNQSKIHGPDIDVKVLTEVKGQRFQGVGKLTSRTKVLVPFIVLLSLIFATPVSLKHKLIALGLGTLVFLIYMMLMFRWTVGYVEKVTGGADITKLWFGQVFNTNIGFMTILPTIIWAAVTLWAVDWEKLKADSVTFE